MDENKIVAEAINDPMTSCGMCQCIMCEDGPSHKNSCEVCMTCNGRPNTDKPCYKCAE